MQKYIMIYRLARPFDLTLLPKEQFLRAMNEWGEWVGRMGPSVIDRGDAFKLGGKSTDGQQVMATDNLTSGYSVISAKDFDQALDFAKQCPVVKRGGRVEIYEAMGTSELK